MRRRPAWIALAMLMLTAGCSSLRECAIGARYHVLASSAWQRYKLHCCDQECERPYLKDFGSGWRQGYYDVANRGSGQLPVVAPPKYWGIHYENPDGHSAMQAWFNGFQEGALAAQQDGVGNWAALPVAAPYEVDESTLSTDWKTPSLMQQPTPASPAPEPPPVLLQPELRPETPGPEELPRPAVPSSSTTRFLPK